MYVSWSGVDKNNTIQVALVGMQSMLWLRTSWYHAPAPLKKNMGTTNFSHWVCREHLAIHHKIVTCMTAMSPPWPCQLLTLKISDERLCIIHVRKYTLPCLERWSDNGLQTVHSSRAKKNQLGRYIVSQYTASRLTIRYMLAKTILPRYNSAAGIDHSLLFADKKNSLDNESRIWSIRWYLPRPNTAKHVVTTLLKSLKITYKPLSNTLEVP